MGVESRLTLEKDRVGLKQEKRPTKNQPWERVTLRPGLSETGWAERSLCGNEDPLFAEGEELELVEKSCTHSEKTNRTMSYRTGLKITSLTEVVCGLDLCNQGNSGEYGSPCHPQPQAMPSSTSSSSQSYS